MLLLKWKLLIFKFITLRKAANGGTTLKQFICKGGKITCGRSSFAGWYCSSRNFCLGFKCYKRKKVIASFEETMFYFNCGHPRCSVFSLHENKPKAFLGGG